MLSKLSTLESLESSCRSLRVENESLAKQLTESQANVATFENELMKEQSARKSDTGRLQSLENSLRVVQQEVNTWKKRHEELLKQRAQIDSQELQQIRGQVVEAEKKADEFSHELNTVKSQYTTLKETQENLNEEKNHLLSQLADLRQTIENLENDKTNTKVTMDKAKALGRKYKGLYEEAAAKVDSQATEFKGMIGQLESKIVEFQKQIGEREAKNAELMQQLQAVAKPNAEFELLQVFFYLYSI